MARISVSVRVAAAMVATLLLGGCAILPLVLLPSTPVPPTPAATPTNSPVPATTVPAATAAATPAASQVSLPATWPPPGAGATTATQQVIFADPWSSDPRDKHLIAESLMNIVRQTPRGATLTLSMFNMTYTGAADELIRAHRRGVNVRVMINHENNDGLQYKTLKRVIGSDRKARSWVVVRPASIRMHSKFLLATSSGGKKNVVWISSGNLTNEDGSHQANDALITTGDKKLYTFLSKQFGLMSSGVLDPARLGRSAVAGTAFLQTFPIVDGGPGNDPVQSLLSNVTCVKDGRRTIIRMAHYIVSFERLYLIDTIRGLKAQGCDVRFAGDTASWDAVTRDALVAPGPGKVDLRRVTGTILHTKITAIDGWDAHGDPLDIAMVGSHNLSGRGLTKVEAGVNDELSLIVWTPAVVHAYEDWVDMVIQDHSKPYAK